MSSRMKKAASTPSSKSAAAAAMATPPTSISGSPAKSGARDRPPSPTMISRIQEKNELASLNDRLAAYIERVRQLETENSRLTRMITTQEETVTREVSGIKSLYDGELASARKLLDDLAKEKAKLQFENGKLKSSLQDVRSKLQEKEREVSALESKLMSAESQVIELQARVNDAVNQKRYYEDEYTKMKKELDAVNKNLAATAKQLEEETLLRVDLENRIQSLKEELAFMTQVHAQEINETASRSRIVIDEVDSRYQNEYDSKMRESLQEMRKENEDQIRLMREETEAMYERKIAELQDLASRSSGTSDKAQAEIRSSRKRLEELDSEVSKLTSKIHSYEARIRDLENQLRNAQCDHAAQVEVLNEEKRRLRAQLQEQLDEYRDLMDVKLQLDTEIAAYRKLLESEELRLNISNVDGTPGRTPASLEPSRKRKRVEPSGSSLLNVFRESSASSDYAVKSSAKDVVEVSEIDAEGKFVKIRNSSVDKDVTVGGWLLKQVVGEQEITYKFHRSIHLKAQQNITVWSSDTEQTHSPPSDLVMKDQAWSTGDEIKVTIVDSKGEEMASQEMKRSAIRTSSMFARSGDESANRDSQKGRKSWGWSLFGTVFM